MKQKRKLRIFISNTFYPAKEVDPADEAGGGSGVASWELRVEGRLLDDAAKVDPSKVKRKFSSFFKSLVIELDKDLYGPDNHLVEWHRTATTQETDGFQVKRPGDRNVRCTILLLLDYQPLQFRLDSRLARLLGIHTQTRPMVISALWQYIKTHKLQVFTTPCFSCFFLVRPLLKSKCIPLRISKNANSFDATSTWSKFSDALE